jgi:hypothetical protein
VKINITGVMNAVSVKDSRRILIQYSLNHLWMSVYCQKHTISQL